MIPKRFSKSEVKHMSDNIVWKLFKAVLTLIPILLFVLSISRR